MKNNILVFLFSLTVSVAFGQEQWTMFSKVTADWCPNCGTYGWTMMKDAIEAVEDENVLVLNLHHSGGLSNPTAEDIVDNFQTFSQPRFFINNDDMSVSSGNVSAKVNELVETVELLNQFAPFASVSSTAVYNGSSIETTADVEFLETSDGNYYLATYLIKDHVIHNQASQGANADHPFVLVDAISSTSFGTPFASPTAMQGMTFSETLVYDITIDEADLADYYVATVIWNFLETTQTYRFFNATRVNIENQASSIDDNALDDAYKITLNNQMLSVETTEADDYTLSVITIDGKVITQNQFKGNTSIDLSHIQNQMVVVNLIKNNQQTTKRFVMN